MTLKEAAKFIDTVSDAWVGSKSDKTIGEVSAEAATHCSKDAVFNIAAYLKYNFGHMHDAMTDADWHEEARALLQIQKQTGE